jgi:hypothetical protein
LFTSIAGSIFFVFAGCRFEGRRKREVPLGVGRVYFVLVFFFPSLKPSSSLLRPRFRLCYSACCRKPRRRSRTNRAHWINSRIWVWEPKQSVCRFFLPRTNAKGFFYLGFLSSPSTYLTVVPCSTFYFLVSTFSVDVSFSQPTFLFGPDSFSNCFP